ncbi:MAG: two-CW domain-containing protein [Nitrospirota bacterium]
MKKSKMDCWEFKKCERELGGEHVHDLGICPASIETKLNGIHGGKNAGRACWVVAGTFCKGQVQGTFAQKYKDCALCDFYKLVKEEESPAFLLSAVLLDRLKK